MSIQAVATGRVVDGPVRLTSDCRVATLFVIRDTDTATVEVDYEVVCRSPRLVRQMLRGVSTGDLLMVFGTMNLRRVGGPIEDDLGTAMVSIEAMTIARVRDDEL